MLKLLFFSVLFFSIDSLVNCKLVMLFFLFHMGDAFPMQTLKRGSGEDRGGDKEGDEATFPFILVALLLYHFSF